MTWKQRLHLIHHRAIETNNFAYDNYVSKLYQELMLACQGRDAKTVKRLIVKMGF